ncbi:MAG: hypothetical protein JWQ70_305 [Aeromicrobium sp.]|nr:hypothetical protein [Aeromicrobium sp.]
MKLRMTMATSLAAVALSTLSGCGKSSDNTPEPAPNAGTSSSATTPTPSPSSTTISTALDLLGDWHDTAAKWTMHFHKDGTFVEDFQGVTDFRVGTYKLDGDTISLIGDDGNTDQGTVKDDTLVFRLGTLTKI